MSGRTSIVLFAIVVAWGCSSRAVRPPSPATSLKVEDLLATSSPPNERYFLIIFGSQSRPKLARYTHTWATMVKVTTVPGRSDPVIETSTISWMPASLVIHPAHFRVEPGVNLSLEASLREAARHKEKVAMWGPYEVWHGLHLRFMTQKAFIESGQIGYQCIDSIGEAATNGNGSDCIHAITDMDPQFGRQQYPLSKFGHSASANVVKQILERPVVIDAPKTHPWLIPLIGLDCNQIEHRHYEGRAVPFSTEAVLQMMSNPPKQSRRSR